MLIFGIISTIHDTSTNGRKSGCISLQLSCFNYESKNFTRAAGRCQRFGDNAPAQAGHAVINYVLTAKR